MIPFFDFDPPLRFVIDCDDFNFNLSVFVKNADDGVQILEQILPFFTPDWTTTIKIISHHFF